MRKFYVLVKKEIKELVTLQTIAPLLFTILIFLFMGNVIGQEGKKAAERQTITVVSLDDSAAAKEAIGALSKANLKVNISASRHIDTVVKETRNARGSLVIVIPSGFGRAMARSQQPHVQTYSIVSNFSFMRLGSATANQALTALNDYISGQLVKQAAPRLNVEQLKNPVKVAPYVVVGDKTAAVSLEQVTGFIMSQSTLIPIVLFMVIILAAQMIAGTVAAEKENKTLETLLSAPVSRSTIVLSKMVASGLLALAGALLYMGSFRYYMEGLTGGAGAGGAVLSHAIKQLGLALTPTGYLLLGISLFFSILCALAIALILGVLAENVRGAQSLTMPLMVLVLVPYVFVLFMDINTMAPWLKYVVYAIPFSHTFMASPNLYFGDYTAVLYGVIYEVVLFGLFVYIAGRIFASDMILTMKLSLKRGSRAT